MSTLRDDLRKYLELRRNLGFKLRGRGQCSAKLRRLRGTGRRFLHHDGPGDSLD